MNRKFITFSIITCIFSWSCWLPIVETLEASPFDSTWNVLLLFFLGAYGPTIVGFFLTYWYEGRKGISGLMKRLLPAKVGIGWTLAILFTGPVLYAVTLMVYVVFGAQTGSVNYGLLPWLPIVFVVPVVFGPLAEEFGWRGFALPQLDHRNKPVQSSIILGLVWALWHAPLFWAKTGTAISGFPVDMFLITSFFLAVTGSSFIYTWIFNRTDRNLFAAILLHLSMNSSGVIMGMLFPDMDESQKLLMYQYYTITVWVIVLTGSLLTRKHRLGSASA
ncbi:MAG TPA: type II CAAX endopeptidase family protein [Ohtaekwangia sp.]